MKYVLPGALVLAGLINIFPVVGVVSTDRLAALYGIDFEGPEIAILMRHRAVLFGLLGAFILFSVFRPAWQPTAITAALVSMLSFIVLAFLVGDYNQEIRKIVLADVIATVALLVALGLRWLKERT